MSAESEKDSPQQSNQATTGGDAPASNPAPAPDAPAEGQAAGGETVDRKAAAKQAVQDFARSFGGALQGFGGRAGRRILGALTSILLVPFLVFRGSLASRLISLGFVASILLLAITGYKLSKRFMPHFEPSKSTAGSSFNQYLEQQKEYAIASASVVFLERYTATVQSATGKVANLEIELYAECDSPDTCSAIKSRIAAIKEVVSGAIQEQSYDALITDEGKDGFKAAIVRELNRHLSSWEIQGTIRRVFFSHFIMA